MMKTIALLISIVGLSASSRITEAEPQVTGPAMDEVAYIKAVNIARESWMAGAHKDNAKESALKIGKLALNPDDVAYPISEYVRCRLLVAASSAGMAEERLPRLLAYPSVAPEVVLGLLELNQDGQENRFALEDSVSQLLPVSIWRSLGDGRRTTVFADIDPPRPTVPIVDRKKLITIAGDFEKAGLAALAWRAYAEAIYAAFSPPWMKEQLDET